MELTPQDWVRISRQACFRVAARTGLSSDDAHEISQAVLLALWRSRKNIEQHAVPKWIRVVSWRMALARLRKRRCAPLLFDGAEAEVSAPAPAVPAETTLDLRRALCRLESQERQLLKLHHLEGMTQEQLAEALGMSLSTTKRRLKRATRTLKRGVALA